MNYGNIILGSLALGAFIALLAVIGEEDYKTAIQEERMACMMVQEEHWPEEVAEGYDCPERIAGASYE